MKDFRQTPLWNNELPIEERLDYLIKELTFDEKIVCMTTGCPDVERLGVKAFGMGGEAAHGIEARHDQAFNAGKPEPTTVFTQPLGMSVSFDRELIKECGRAVGEEARALYTRNEKGGLCRWAPTVDMERDPRWGRTEEAYGEDPYLAGEMASSYIRGMQGEDPFYLQCGATLKHFYANNVETDRIKISSSLDGRNKYEYYLEPFRKAIEEGRAEAVMTAYNEINGIPAIVSDEVQKLLKDSWGLPGHVVCDGGDMQQTVKDHQYFETHAETIAYGLKAGIDCFTDDREVVMASTKEAFEKGLITEEDINRSVRNSFRTRIRLGFYDSKGDCPYTGMGETYLNNNEHEALAAQMAENSVVLLKNEKNILPIIPGETASLAVVGPLANIWNKDWYCGIPPYTVSVYEGIKRAYPDTTVTYKSGLSEIYLTCNGSYVGLDEEARLILTDKERAEAFTYNDWGCGSSTLIAKSSGLYVTLEEGSYLIKADKKEAFSWFIREAWNFEANEEGVCVISSWNGRKVTVDKDGYLVVIKTDQTVPGEGDDHKVSCTSYAVWEGAASAFRIETISDGIAEAVQAVRNVDKAVLVIGCNPVINSKEEIDRTTIELPPAQQKLADSVLSANPNTVVVLISNYPYAINQLQKEIPGILWSVSGSQEIGTGIASIISGKANPAGRLNMTWYRSDEDLPDISDYDIIQGKRTYQYFDREVLYPFGYGLSYTQFSYSDLSVVKRDTGILVRAHVTNTGDTMGDEVVQLYMHKEVSRVKQPIKQLKGFERVKDIAPGESREVSFQISYDELRYYDVITQSMFLETGKYSFLIGASSADIRQRESIFVEGQEAVTRNPYEVTAADRYDGYENVFIHKGACGNTCIIPGKAGDSPDNVDNAVLGKVSGALTYRDMIWNQKAGRCKMQLHGLEEGSIRFSLASEQRKTDTFLQVSKSTGFEEITVTLPEDFVILNENCTLRIEVEGKIKLSTFCFCL